MATIQEQLKEMLEGTAAAFDDFKKHHNDKVNALRHDNDALRDRLEELEAKQGAPRATRSIDPPAFELIDKDGQRFPALTKAQSFHDYIRTLPASENEDRDFSLGEYVRGAIMGRKVASGTALVPTRIGAQIIDDVRAQTALIRAGAVSVPIQGPTNLARVTGDATVIEHTEAAADITEGNPTFVAVALNPKTLASLIPLSLEVVQDSPNLDNAIRTSVAAAMALKLDQLGIAAILADSNIPDSAAAHDPATWSGTMLAVGAAMAANQPIPDAAIVNSANLVARHSILESTAGGWLGKPPLLANMLEIPTTSMTADISVLGGFQRGVGIAMRQDLTLEMIRYGKPTWFARCARRR
jgi:hypothetical protein